MATYVDFANFDDATTPLGGAISSCMEYCIPDCCGLNAYNVTAENMTTWAVTVTPDIVDQAKHDVDRTIERVELGPEIVSFFNDSYGRTEVIAWCHKVRDVLEQVRPLARYPNGSGNPPASQIQGVGTTPEPA